jgi:hypothetical protein
MLKELFSLLVIIFHGVVFCQTRAVDFKFAPANYLTAICLPDDWQKTLLSEKGALAYDFGPGPYAKPLTEIAVGVKEQESHVTRQYLAEPRFPIVTTEFRNGGLAMQQQAFALIPDKLPLQTPSRINEKIRRLEGLNGCMAWAAPAGKVDPAFRNVAWGNNRPIRYRVKTAPGSKKRVAMGVCESYKPRPGTRILELRVEGAAPLTVDPMASGEKNHPYVFLIDGEDENHDGELAVEAHASTMSPDPNVILNAFWIFPENTNVTTEEILRGGASARAEIYFDCGTELETAAPFPRIDGMIATLADSVVTPIITIRSPRPFTFDSTTGILSHRDLPYLLSRPRAVSCRKIDNRWQLELPRGTKRVELIVMHGNKGRESIRPVPDLTTQLQRARRYWRDAATIPKNKILAPDKKIQYLIDANVRNVYQVREHIDGHLQFHPGPTVYRGLWLADVMLTGIPVAMLGDTAGMRRFLENGRRYQLPNGQLRVMYPTLALIETPVFIYTLCWFAQSTGNKIWLQKNWPVVTHGLEWIRQMRAQTLGDPAAPYFGLMPAGFVDGGISTPTADYGSLWWSMIALERSIEAARWLGQNELAESWQKLFNDFMTSFRRAARRDLRKDRHGNLFLPISVGDTTTHLPQKGQYAFLLPLRYAKFFHRHDALLDSVVAGNLAMLEATMHEGLITSSGWLHNGVWPWLGGIHGIAHELFGNHARAHDLLYAYANHAAPVGTWVEEQHTRDAGNATAGDVSNAEASAVFVHLVRILLVRERLDDLELFAGVPEAWLVPNARIELNAIATDFGPVTLRLTISADGQLATLFVAPIDGRGSAGKPVVVLQALKKLGFVSAAGAALPDKIAGVWKKPMKIYLRKPK